MRTFSVLCALALLAVAANQAAGTDLKSSARHALSNAEGVTLGAKAGTLLKEHLPVSHKN